MALFLTNSVGLSGSAGMFAPLPSSEIAESPIVLNAVTLAYMEAELGRLNGVKRSVAVGMVQLLIKMIDESFSASQSIKSF